MGLSVDIKKKVNGFSLDVAWKMDNELAVLFGYSGAGKSITLQMIAGLMRPDEGIVCSGKKVLFDSAKGINVPPQQRSLGYVFQDLALFPHMTVRENIRYGASGVDTAECNRRIGEILSTFRLEGLETKIPYELSGGQRQRVAFARALIRRPDALLLDEPFSALDTPLRIEMCRFLDDIRNTFSIPVVLVTHDLSEAYTMAGRVIIYVNGAIAQTGTPSEVFNNPANREVEILVDTKRLSSHS